MEVADVFSIIAGHDPRDATTFTSPVAPLDLELKNERPLAGLRLGVPEEYFIPGMQPEVEDAVRSSIEIFVSLGATRVSISLPHTRYALPVYYLLAPAEASANLARYDGVRYGARSDVENMWDIFLKTRGQHFGLEVKRRIMFGTYTLSTRYYDAYYNQAQKVRTLIQQDFEHAFERVDLIAAPVTPTTAFRLGEHINDPLAMYLEDVFTLPANLAGIPGLAFPIGFDHQNLPIGMQLMAPGFHENRLFQAGIAYQQVTDWHLRRPDVDPHLVG
jgi:aspartyl-tRNA(Asn)/glutamyl-tRNA(Gln) amidotransferase subunit A